MPTKYQSAAARQLAGSAGITVGANYLESATSFGGTALTYLHWSRDALAAIEAGRREAIGLARAEGASWTDIGTRLGMTKQAAQQRYG